MNKTRLSKFQYLIVLTLLLVTVPFSLHAQQNVGKNFETRFDEIINGDFTIIANNSLSNNRLSPYNGNGNNHDTFINMVYVDIDGTVDLGIFGQSDDTFNSSSATLENPFPTEDCFKIRKAYLYWSAADFVDNDFQENISWWNFNDVAIKLPNQQDYTLLTAESSKNEIIFRARNNTTLLANYPYACVKDITYLINELDSPFGEYTVANVEARRGELFNNDLNLRPGTSGGWQIIFVYENDKATKRKVSIYDGYKQVSNDSGSGSIKSSVEINIQGFKTLPGNSPVNANIAFGALEGDRGEIGIGKPGNDYISIKKFNTDTFIELSTANRPSNDFFNSKITIDDNLFNNRNPNSSNTLGFDAGVFKLDNPQNDKIIGNGQEEVDLRISSDFEAFGLFMIGFSVEVFEPNLGPMDSKSTASNTSEVTPDEEITHSIVFENNGNDNAQNTILTTKIAPQLELIETSGSYPNGITFSYNETSRILTFKVPDNLVTTNSPKIKLDYKTKVKPLCYFLTENCDLIFNSQIKATYDGVYNNNTQTTVSSSEIGLCSGNNAPNNYKVKLTAPQWGNSIDKTLECDDTQGLKNAQAVRPTIMPECDGYAYDITKIAGKFVQTNKDCAVEGYYENTFTFKSLCGDSIGDIGIFKQKINVVDTTPPVIEDCSDKLFDLVLECEKKESLQQQADDWHKKNLQLIAQCAKDNCSEISIENIKHNYGFIATDKPICEVNGQKTPIEYKIFDACGTAKPVIKILNIIYKDESGPEVELCKDKIKDVTEIECTNSDPLQAINDWNTKNVKELLGCAEDACNPELPVSVIDSLGPFNKTCGNSGTIEAFYYALDTCKQRSVPIKALLRIKDNTGPIVPDECRKKLDAQGECNEDATEEETIVWNKNNYENLKCAIDDCSAIKSITDDYNFANYQTTDCGGKLKVTYFITDDCDNTTAVEAFFYTGDAQPPLITCTFTEDDNLVLECGIDDYFEKIEEWKTTIENKLTSDGCIVDECSPDLIPILTNNLDSITLKDPVDCGEENASKNPVEFYITDNCENTRVLPLTIYIQDTTAPDITPGCAPTSKTFACQATGVTLNTIQAWDDKNKNDLIACATDGCAQKADISVTSTLDINNLPAPDCPGKGKAQKVTYNLSDGCNIAPFTVNFKIEDATPPIIDNSCLTNLRTIVECAGDNVQALKTWEQEIIGKLRACSSDGCALTNQLNISSNLDSIQWPKPDCKNLAKPVNVKFSVKDICGNAASYVLPVKIQDTTPPQLNFNLKNYYLVRCDSVPPVPNASFKDNCFGVASQTFTSDTIYDNKSDDFKIVRTWNVSDGCQSSKFTQTIDVKVETFISNYDNKHCIDDGLINLNNYVDKNETTLVDWKFVDGPQKNITINPDGTFDPMQINLDSLGTFSFNYFSTRGLCYEDTAVKLNINDDCVVYPCGPENFTFSKTITPNGDDANEYFTVKGSRECEFQIDVKIFNRWGAIIYENDNYQNDWNGFTSNTSIGSNGTVTNGTYYYIVNLIDSGFKRFTGPIYIGTK